MYYTRYEFELFSNFTFFREYPEDGDQIKQKEKRDLFGYNGSYSKMFFAGNRRITTEWGTNLRFDRTKNSELSRTKNRTELMAPLKLGDIDESNLGLYFNGTIDLTNKLTLNTGLRFDQFYSTYADLLQDGKISRASAGIVSPKLNFYYQANNKTQFYLTAGKGFHSNDTRVNVETNGMDVLPAAYGADLGAVLKPAGNLLINAALWYLWMEQEFVYVGDEGIVEPGGESRRFGFDLSVRYQPVKWLYFDFDINLSNGRSTEEPKGINYLPLAPDLTSIGGITIKTEKGIKGSMRYRYMSDRPANEDNSVVAEGYMVSDLFLSYERSKYEIGISIQNLFNTKWKETQFETQSRLRHETAPVSEIPFTPGTPFFPKVSLTWFF